jgi:hypothetical protein
MGVTASWLPSLMMRVRTAAAILMFASQSCRSGDGGPTSLIACPEYCEWAVKCVGGKWPADFEVCQDACETEMDSCSRGHELDAIDELMDCADRSCGDSCAANEHDDCTFAWP